MTETLYPLTMTSRSSSLHEPKWDYTKWNNQVAKRTPWKHLYAAPNSGKSEITCSQLQIGEEPGFSQFWQGPRGELRQLLCPCTSSMTFHRLTHALPCTPHPKPSRACGKLILVHTHFQITVEWVFYLFTGLSPQCSRRTLAFISQPRIPFIVLSTKCFQFPSHLPITKASMCTLSVYFTHYSLDSS